eukprot:CAMPEP_0117428002 /NCGR_PEP_ID=MMETSP0758-20121206/7782_1 /TAXON_ID=63605 /ORGANISM="Percolomonas cosmopolitus, Strain AE-1 (ATCC 50343)" /LENGTH=43 /DNA_ID= /DNA_START= /DNA_END= /DNA_ORIENTATION=
MDGDDEKVGEKDLKKGSGVDKKHDENDEVLVVVVDDDDDDEND